MNFKERFFHSLNDLESCKKAIKEVALSFYIFAGLWTLSVFLSNNLNNLWIGIVIVMLTLIMHLKQSRVIAILFLLITLKILLSTILQHAFTMLFLSIVLLILAIRGVQATFVYHKLMNQTK